MLEKKARKIGIFTLLGTCLLMSIIFVQISTNEININNNVDNIEKLNPIKSVWYLTGIYIDDDDNDWDWDEFTNDNPQPWCTFSGGVYYIKNVVINGGGRITIQHSDVNFVIQNCTVINSNNEPIGLIHIHDILKSGNC